MSKFGIHRGTISLGILIAISFGSILLALCSLPHSPAWQTSGEYRSVNSTGVQPYSVSPREPKQWWEQGKPTEGKSPVKRTHRITSPMDLSLPNTGLKDPADITWPYEDEFTYELNLRDWIALPGSEHTTDALCKYVAGNKGGTFEERKIRQSGYETSEGIFMAEFDQHRKTKAINYTFKGRTIHPMGTLTQDFYIKIVHDGDKISISSDWPFAFLDNVTPVNELEIDAPIDGFYDFTGSDSPSSMAVLLSAVDLDGDEPVEFWAFGLHGITIGDGVLEFITNTDSLFTRFTITPLEKCSEEAKGWWERSRDYYDGWRPPDNVRTYLVEGDAEAYYGYLENEYFQDILQEISGIYSPNGPWVAAYVDEEGRLIRIEQPTDVESPLTTLTNIGGEKAWWERS